MKNNFEVRVCKNKKCRKGISAAYKHKYCEAWRNQYAQKVKDGILGTIGGAATFISAAVLVKINSKK